MQSAVRTDGREIETNKTQVLLTPRCQCSIYRTVSPLWAALSKLQKANVHVKVAFWIPYALQLIVSKPRILAEKQSRKCKILREKLSKILPSFRYFFTNSALLYC